MIVKPPYMAKKYSELLAERKTTRETVKKEVLKQQQNPEYKKKQDSVKYVIRDGFFSSIKSGFTESFIMPFAIALQASTGMLAAIASVPQLVASLFQLLSKYNW